MLGTPREIAYEIPDGLVRALFDSFLIDGCPEVYPPPESWQANDPEESAEGGIPIAVSIAVPPDLEPSP
jgi:hypothetical protein